MALYWLRYGDVEVDGVLALDQQAIQLLVAALQPIELEGYPGPVTGENVIQSAVFATFLALAPQKRIETRFVYDLLPGVVERNGDIWRYRLYVQKQGGTGGNELMMALNLPIGAEVVAASPPPTRRNGDTLSYKLELYSDVELCVEWEGGGR